jgi:hypothetical protein
MSMKTILRRNSGCPSRCSCSYYYRSYNLLGWLPYYLYSRLDQLLPVPTWLLQQLCCTRWKSSHQYRHLCVFSIPTRPPEECLPQYFVFDSRYSYLVLDGVFVWILVGSTHSTIIFEFADRDDASSWSGMSVRDYTILTSDNDCIQTFIQCLFIS